MRGDDHNREKLEASVRKACEAADYDRAATLVLEGYGPQVYGFLSARMRSPSDASEVFSIFAERLWLGLPDFAWRCSVRGYCYTLARNAAHNYTATVHNRGDRMRGLSDLSHVSKLAERVRSETRPHLRTDVKDRVRELREQLPEDDQTLLILRVDRGLAWNELAVVMGEPTGDGQQVARSSARLRKRFSAIKSKLRELAQQDGLL